MILQRTHRPLFLMALLLCLAVIAIEVMRWLLAGRGIDEPVMTTALLLSAGMAWCLNRSTGEAGARG